MTSDNPDGGDALTDLKYVGPATAESVAEADIDAEDFRDKRVSYRMLVEAGTNPGVATKIRREHSLPWSITGSSGEDLDKRSDQVRGLQDEERAWVAASSGDWADGGSDDTESGRTSAPATSGTDTPTLETGGTDGTGESGGSGQAGSAEADGSGEMEDAEAAWRERSKPDPVTEVDGVDEAVGRKLASAGINSVRSLATADPESVADVLGYEEEQVAEWVEAADRMG